MRPRRSQVRTPEQGSPDITIVNHNRRRFPLGTVALAAVTGAALYAGASILGWLPRFGVKTEESAQTKDATITKITPIDLACRARTDTVVVNQAKINKKLFGVDLAADVKANTTEYIQTYTCVSGEGVRVVVDQATGGQTVYVPTSSLRMFSEIDASRSRTVTERDATSETGKAIVGFLEAATPFNGPNKKLEKEAAKLGKIGEASAINTAEGACGSVAWNVMPEVINEGYDLAAINQGLDPDKIAVQFVGPRPTFAGKYQLPDGYEIISSVKGGCKLSADAYIPDVRTYTPATVPTTASTAEAVREAG